MAISYNFYKLEILGVHSNGKEIGATTQNYGLLKPESKSDKPMIQMTEYSVWQFKTSNNVSN